MGRFVVILPIYPKMKYNQEGIMCVEAQPSCETLFKITSRDLCGDGRLGEVS